MNDASSTLVTIGWREWVSLPTLGIARIKAKIDTGARTSCLHAFSYERLTERGAPWLRFHVHPMQGNTEDVIVCMAPLIDERMVSDSGGHRELRPIISTRIAIGDTEFDAEFTLTNRDSMRFRMLLGRVAMAGRFLVNPKLSFQLSKRPQPKPVSK